ncbi:MAG: LysR family transcriptional regulator [Roseburia sp.]|nr:LysR family transcriptional regulator [Ruminococcus sp.]MCM1155745.1 LysR family transcriptional regulator [Roseburia sp.]MCM1243967.1 LysR family transcriptional regulator [Roseburia sp.]
MDTQSLLTFVTLAEYRNFTRTADALFIAQSTVTNRIAELEKEIGKPLFARNKRKVTLSQEGELFLPYARRILELSDAGIRNINSMKKYSTLYRIGSTNTIYECHLLPVIQDYMRSHPEQAVKITLGHSNDLLQEIQDGLLDVAYSYLPFYHSAYNCEVFATDNLVLVTRAGNDAWQKGITKERLADADYLFCNFALQDVGLFIKELFPPHYQFGFEIDNSTKLIPYLLSSDGISFVPENIAAPYVEQNELRRIPLLDFEAPKINCYRITRK